MHAMKLKGKKLIIAQVHKCLQQDVLNEPKPKKLDANEEEVDMQIGDTWKFARSRVVTRGEEPMQYIPKIKEEKVDGNSIQ